MRRIYTTKDVKQILAYHGYIWNGYFFDHKTRYIRLMSNEDLWNNDQLELSTTYEDESILRLFTINEFEFKKGAEVSAPYNWSNEWQEFLLEKYPTYAEKLIDHSLESINRIEKKLVDVTQNLITKLTQIKQSADEEKEQLQQTIKLAEEQRIKNKEKRKKYDVDYIRPYQEADDEE